MWIFSQDMARYLIIGEGVSVNAQDNAGWTPLHEACCTSNPQLAEILVDLLLRSGADVNISAKDGTRSNSCYVLNVVPMVAN